MGVIHWLEVTLVEIILYISANRTPFHKLRVPNTVKDSIWLGGSYNLNVPCTCMPHTNDQNRMEGGLTKQNES